MLSQRLQQHIFSRYIYLYAVLGSCLLAIIIWSWQQPFNSDGVLYLKTAAIYQQHGFAAALKSYSWPFMSIIIAGLSTLTHLSLLQSAYLFNLITDTLTLVTALALATAFGCSRRQQALLLLLLLIFPWFNHLRQHILRGHGYYAASLLAMLLLVHHARQPRLLLALGFTVMMTLATLFRIEGIVILLLAPLVLLFACEGGMVRRGWALLSCYLLPIVFVLASLGMMTALCRSNHFSWQNIDQIRTDVLQPLHQSWHAFMRTSDKVARYVLPFHSKMDSIWLLAGGVIAMLLRQIILTLGIVYCVLAGYTLCQRPLLPTRRSSLIVATWLLLTLATALVFVAERFFLTQRYLGLFALIAVLILPRGISQIYRQCRGRSWRQRAVLGCLLLALLYNMVATVWHFGPSKYYVIQAGRWIQHHLPAQAAVYIIDPQLAYYAKRPLAPTPLLPPQQASTQWLMTVCQHYDYLAVKISRKKTALMATWEQSAGKPIQRVGRPHEGHVVIFACPGRATIAIKK